MRTQQDGHVFCGNIQRIIKQVPFVNKVALFIECLRNQFLIMVTENYFNVSKIKDVGSSLADIFQEEDNSGIAKLLQMHRSYLLVSKTTMDFAHKMDYPAKFNHNFTGNENLQIGIWWGNDQIAENFTFNLQKYHLQKWLPNYILEEEETSEEEEKDRQLNFGYFWTEDSINE
jgi:hypothetical protein